jgi:CHAD domain-containing protein
MAAVIPLPSPTRAEHRGLAYWMDRVLKELEKLRKAPDPDAVHDLRVALRRCRSLAAVMEEVDAHPAWQEMRKTGRKLFRSLGELRDLQVQQDWVKKLSPEGDSLGGRLSVRLAAEEDRLRDAALRKVGKFDGKLWKRLARTLAKRMQLVPLGSPAAECLALERLEEARELHRRALRTDRPKPWHRLRIGLKRFRYAVEGLLPEHYAAWSDGLKRVQDLLGDVHDLDVLAEIVKDQAAENPSALSGAWAERIEKERTAGMESYRQLALGTASVWNRWRLGLPSNGKLHEAAMARLQATARACDAHRRRTAQTARLAESVFEALRRAKCDRLFAEEQTHRVFAAAALLHGIRPADLPGPQQKAAAEFLRGLAAPAGWTAEDWELAAAAVRYHRGKEPKNGGKLARLSEEEKKKIFVLAGVLRIARALRKIGIAGRRGIRAGAVGTLTISVPRLPDTPDVAARLAAAKHLLERGLGRPIVIKAAERANVLTIPAEQMSLDKFAAASD